MFDLESDYMAINISFHRVVLVKEKGVRYDIERRIKTPRDSYDAVKAIYDIENFTQEVFIAIFLSTKNDITGIHEIFRGSINSCLVDAKLVFQSALLHNAASIILIHNHPSGDTTPSSEDLELTRKLVECGKIMDMHIIDHLIIGHDSYTSLKEKGII